MGIFTECLVVLVLCGVIGFITADVGEPMGPDDFEVDVVKRGILTCYNSEGVMVNDGDTGVIDNDAGCWECPCVDGSWPATEDVASQCTDCGKKKRALPDTDEFTDQEVAAYNLLDTISKRGGCSKPKSSNTKDVNNFNKQLLAWHNYYRCKHGVKNLQLDTGKLQTVAKKNVDTFLPRNMEHTANPKYGENLYVSWSSSGFGDTTAEQVVSAWYDEIKDYRFSDPKFDPATGHFTQVMWKNSKKLGCYAKQGNDQGMKKVYVACEYDPRGNVNIWGPPAKNKAHWKDQVPSPK